MDINDIMTDGKIDGDKMKRVAIGCPYSSHDFDGLASVINAHIDSLKQETPITPELLERAGFSCFGTFRYEKESLYLELRNEVVCYTNRKSEGGTRTRIVIGTMQELSLLAKVFDGQPLNWQEPTEQERLHARLIALGFEQTKKGCFFLGIGMIYFNCFINNGFFVEMGAAYSMGEFVATNIKTIDALERVVKGLRGESD